MDAESFALTRNNQQNSFATCFTRVGFDIAQAKLIESCITEDSSPPFLAATILLLPTASQLATAAVCNQESAQADLLEYARRTTRSNRQQVTLFADQTAFAHPPATSLSPNHSQGVAIGSYAHIVPIPPAVQTEFDNGGISHRVYFDDGADEDEELTECVLQTTDEIPGTQSLNNLVPFNKLKRKFPEAMQLGPHSAKIMAQYVSKVTEKDFVYKSLPDVRTGDHARLMLAGTRFRQV
jgi:hypothetical protein